MKKTYLTLIIMLLLVGFAAVSANLVLSGTLKIGFNREQFEEGVVFTKANAYNGEATIETEEKSISYQTYKLDNIGEESALDYAVTNKSNQYDADVTITCDLNDTSSEYTDYIELTQDINEEFALQAGETKNGRVTVKLKKSYVANENRQVQFTCTIEATAKEKEEIVEYKPETIYTEIALKGADPVLEGTGISTVSLEEKEEKKLIPVTISENGTVTYADITQKWYDYEKQEWANAVILSNYNHIPKVGEVIKEEDIEAYFVWIPKYRYQLWNVSGENKVDPFEIQIEFGTEDTTDDKNGECTTPLNKDKTQALSGDSGQCENGMWMTHPAFITMGVNGFWVGKFEVGYKQGDDFSKISSWTKEGAEKGTIDSTKVIVKPNVYSWRSINNKNMFNTLKEYASNLESHMMKNTEWGAVAYLSHSKYGIKNEVAQNTNTEYKTGFAQTDNSIVPYPSQAGFIASTTGNITGIYDMSGGAWERMASYRDVENATDRIGLYEFTKQETIDIGEKYFDVYDKSITVTSYEKRILGDATGEMGPFSSYRGWYQDSSSCIDSEIPWLIRGGNSSSGSGLAGQFNFARSYGGANGNDGFRVVLSPQ